MGRVFLFGLSNIHFHKVPSTEGPKEYVSTVCSTPATCPWGSGVQVPWRSLGALYAPITLPLLKHRWAIVKSETGSSLGISKGK